MNIKELRNKYKLSQEQLSSLTGIPKGRIAMWEYRNSVPKQKDFEIISKFFEKIDNKMLSKDLITNDIDNKSVYNEAELIGEINEREPEYFANNNNQFIDLGGGYYQMLVPLVSDYAYGGYLTGFSDAEYVEELPKFPIIVTQQHKGIYRAFKVRGESMNDNSLDAIIQTDVALGRRVEKDFWKNKLHLKKWKDYIIVHQEGIIIKRISEHDVENGVITCESLNPDKAFYPTRKIYLNEVNELFNIIQIVRTK